MTGAAENINKMSDTQRAQFKKFLVRLILKCLSALAAIGVIGALLKMNDNRSEIDRYRNEGAVSRAVVLDKRISKSTTVNNRGRKSFMESNYVGVVHNPKSPVRYADLDVKVKEADLPVSKAPSDGTSTGAVKVSDDAYAQIKIGDTVTVVNTPYDPSFPKLLSEVRHYSPNVYYLWAAVFGVLAIAFWWMAGRFAKP